MWGDLSVVPWGVASTDVVVAYLGLAQGWGERSQGTRSCWQQDRQQVAGTIG